MKKIHALLLLFFLCGGLSYGQDAEVRGFLYDKSNGEPLIFSTVILKGTNFAAYTDANGFYSITKIPAGTYTLIALGFGFDTVYENITLNKGQILSKNYNLSIKSTIIDEIEIKGEKIDRTTNVNVGITKITPREIKILPSIGGEPDLAQYIQTLPGVVFTGDQGGQLYIRGGAPVQNLSLIDGMLIYNPFHSIGLFSVFDTDIIRSVDIYTGGFKADYGGRNSSVIDIKTRDGNKKEFQGKVSVNPFTSKAVFEGPLKKQKGESQSGISYLLTSRNSYLDKTSPILYSYANDKGELPFSFNDTYGKITMQSNNGSKFSIYGFNFLDRANLDSLNDMNWQNYGIGTNFILLPSTNSTMITGYFGYSNYKINISELSQAPRYSGVNGFNFGMNFNYFIGKNEIKYGIEMIGNTTEFLGYNPQGTREEERMNNTEIAGFFRYKIVKTRYVLEPSLRLHYYASLNNFSPEPRLGFKYNVFDNFRFKFSGGWFSQNLIATRSDRDVVNLFNGYLSSPGQLSDSQGNRIDNKLQKARHIILGFEFDFLKYFEFDFEPYIKDFNQLININRDYKIEADYLVESGLARGLDFQLKYDYKKTFIQIGYSLGQVTRVGLIDGSGIEKRYPTNYDRRHNLNFLASYKWGKNKSWETSLRWNLGSGFPFTPTKGFYEDFLFLGNLNQNITTTNGDLGIRYGVLNSERLPYFHRLDFSIKKTIKFKNNTEMEINGGVINLYNRQNLFYVDRVTNVVVNQLPILPSIGLSYSF